ncbi:MAG TPA: lysylphosphatidylglycerol synthase transmembrane domain-containing protein [Candidatus Aquicultoraceae bacterium]|nr:lysylphosphatidylglycerol synthase transmembrane domain-containing protein [Candidatus Aquicultoraceae bacterium]
MTAGVFGYQFHRVGPGEKILIAGRLQWGYFLFLIFLFPAETILSALRMRMICKVLQPDVSFRTCIMAELANAGMAILTPSQTGGGPGQMYMLHRGGAKMGTALTISLLTFMGTMVSLLGMGVYTLIAVGSGRVGLLFAAAVYTITAVAALILSSAAWPGLFRTAMSGSSRLYRRMRGGGIPPAEWWPPGDPRTGPAADRMGPLAIKVVDMLYVYREELGRFLRKGKAVFLLTCLLSLLFFCSRILIAFLCVRFLGIRDSSFGEIAGIQAALAFVTYFGPTPGSAGIAEGASLLAMDGIVTAGFAPYYNLLWRFFSAYLAAFAGILLIFRSVFFDVRRQARRKWKGGANPP